MPELREASEAQLLVELLDRCRLQQGPERVSWSSAPLAATVAIGRDHAASIFLDHDDYQVLRAMAAEPA